MLFEKCLGIYFGIGLLLVLQNVIRNWRYTRPRGMEGASTLIGMVTAWPIHLVADLYTIWRDRRASRK